MEIYDNGDDYPKVDILIGDLVYRWGCIGIVYDIASRWSYPDQRDTYLQVQWSNGEWSKYYHDSWYKLRVLS